MTLNKLAKKLQKQEKKIQKQEVFDLVVELASRVANLEGKKSQVKIGDIREILKILVQIEDEKSRNDEMGDVSAFLFDETAKLRRKREKK